MSDAAVREIAQQVIDTIGVPHDSYEIAAQLEILGLRDSDARERFGCVDLFDVARRAFGHFERGELRPAPVEPTPQESFSGVLRFFRDFARSLTFSLPMLLQGVTLLLTGYGLWGGSQLEMRTATAIALGFIASYIVTGGLTHALIRRGLYYRYQEEGALARWSVWRLYAASLRIVAAAAIALLLLNGIMRWLPWSMTLVALFYYAALALLWLHWSILYLVERSIAFVVAVIAGLAVVIVAGRFFALPVVTANLAGLIVANCIAWTVGWYSLRRWAEEGTSTSFVNPPRLAVIVYGTARVFLYGLLFSTFIFADRIIAWSTERGREDFPPYGFWLSARYELGMDFALVVVILLGGVIEFLTRRFSERLVPEQKRTGGAEVQTFAERFASNDRNSLFWICMSALAAVGLSLFAFFSARKIPDPILRESLLSATTTRVFLAASISYALFMVALRDVLVLLTLLRTEMAVRLMATALLVNVVVGFVASRAFHYSAAVFGLLAGAVALLVLSRRTLRSVVRDLDYFYYSAY